MKYAVLLLLSCLTANVHASLLNFDFFQGGFEEGAFVTGSFAGEDVNGDGQLVSFDSEIYDFSMSFSGNSLVSAFSLTSPDVFSSGFFGLVYDLDGGPLGDSGPGAEGIAAESADYTYLVGPGPRPPGAEVSGFGATSNTQELVIVTASVPEPTSIALLGLGLLGLGRLRKK